MRIVRFLGAFGHSADLRSALLYECRTKAERCATSAARIKGCAVALEFGETSVVRRFAYDCWSHRSQASGRLLAGRVNPHSDHDEIWVRGTPSAILIGDWATEETKRLVHAIARMNHLPVKAL